MFPDIYKVQGAGEIEPIPHSLYICGRFARRTENPYDFSRRYLKNSKDE